jgi:hypothetical protein
MGFVIFVYIRVIFIFKTNDMKIELKNVKFYERLSEETTAFTADVFANGKKIGYAKNDGCGGCTDIRQIGGVNSNLFVECVNWLKTQPEINIGTDNDPFMVNSDMENKVDQLFEQWFKGHEQKKFEKKMVNHLMWGVPNGSSYTSVKFLKPLNQIDHDILQKMLDKYKLQFKTGSQFLNTNLVGFKL